MPGDSPRVPATAIHIAVHGDGVPLLLGFPIMASHGEIFGEAGAAVLRGYLDRLTDRYRVLLVDYPSIGRSGSIPPNELTADRVCADLLRAADMAGFDRFAYWAHSWGGAVGLQLATRTDRLTALVCSGWPPLGGPYPEVLEGARRQLASPPAYAMAVLRDASQYAQWVTFYESVLAWPEAAAVARIGCPRLAIAGSLGDSDAGGVDIPIVSRTRAYRSELEAMGWCVREIEDRDHSVCLDPEAVVPAVRAFLDLVT
jgi:pimeloyl-ACP methyl ester carboxylesterase